MKKSIILILAVLMLPVSCERVELPAGSAKEQHDDSIKDAVIISAKADSETKAVLRDGNVVAFQNTDAISVFSGRNDGFYKDPFTALKVYSDGTADFQGKLTEPTDEAMVVMYPYQESDETMLAKNGKNRNLYFTLPVEQVATAGGFDPAAFICTGLTESASDGALSVSLGTVCALVKFTMPEGSYSKATLTANAGEPLAGACRVSKSDSYKGNVSVGLATGSDKT